MAKDNIYDKIISELILSSNTGGMTGGSNSGPYVVVTATIPQNDVLPGFTANGVIFSSEVYNIPTDYEVDTHRLVFTNYFTPNPPSTATQIDSGPENIHLPNVGDSYSVHGEVVLTHPTLPTIAISATFLITAAAPMYYGIKAYEANPTLTGLASTVSTDMAFTIPPGTSTLGRLYVVTPTTISGVVDPNGLILDVPGHFTHTHIGNLEYYVLNYDTQFTGPTPKTFTIIL